MLRGVKEELRAEEETAWRGKGGSSGRLLMDERFNGGTAACGRRRASMA